MADEKKIVLELEVQGISKEAEQLSKVEIRLQELAKAKSEYMKLAKTEKGLTEQQQQEYAALNQELAEQKQLRTNLNKELNNSIKVQKAEVGSINLLRARNAELRKEMNSLNLTTKEGQKRLAEIRVEYDKNNTAVRNFDRSLSGSNTLVGEYSKGITDVGASIRNMALGFIGVQQALSFVKDIINTRAEFQKFEIVLGNTLGSAEKATSALDMVAKFAAKTPFAITELTDSFVKLANRGLVVTEEEMSKIGDVASVTGKSFDQLTEAILDVSNSERWREMGIVSEKVGNKVRLTFKGVTKEVDGTIQGVMGAVSAFGEMDGVMGANEKIAASLTGQLSNMGDSWDILLNNLGKFIETPTSAVLTDISTALNGLSEDMANASDKSLPLADRIAGMIDTFARVSPALFAVNEKFKEFIGLNDVLEKRQFERDLADAKIRGKNEAINEANAKRASKKRQDELDKLAEDKQEIKDKKKKEKDAIADAKRAAEQKEKERLKQIEDDKKEKSEQFKAYVELSDEIQRKKDEDAKNKEIQDQNDLILLEEQLAAELQLVANNENKKQEVKINALVATEEAEKKSKDEKIKLAQSVLDTSMQFANIYTSFLDAKMQSELAAAGDNEAKKEQIRKEFAKKRQTAAIAETVIGVAQAVVNAMNTIPFIPMGLIAASIAAVQGAIQIKTIKSQKFETGGLIQTGNELPNTSKSEDNTLILAKPGEVILNETQQSKAGGADFFKRLGVPGFATGGIVGGISAPIQSNPMLNVDSIVKGISGSLGNLKVVLNVNELNDAQDELSVINETNVL